jgi:hypothetical protein
VAGIPNPIGAAAVVVVDDGGIVNDGIVDVLVMVGSVVVVIGWARRLERAVFADDGDAVVTGRKLIEEDAIVAAGGLNEIGAADGALKAVVVVDGVANEKAGFIVVETAVAAVVVVGNVNDGIA